MREIVSMTVAIIAALIAIVAVVSGVVTRSTASLEANSIGENELAVNSITSSNIKDGEITLADLNIEVLSKMTGVQEIIDGTIIDDHISNIANIDPSKISGTAWTSENDGSESGLDADTFDGIDSSQFLRNDKSSVLYGNLNVTENIFFSNKIRYYMIPACGFQGETSETPYNLFNGGQRLRNSDESFNPQTYVAPVNLPHGATITDIAVNSVNNVQNGENYLSLIKQSSISKYYITSINLTYSDVSSILINNTEVSETVDNYSYMYYVQLSLDPEDEESDVELIWVRITYTVTQPLP